MDNEMMVRLIKVMDEAMTGNTSKREAIISLIKAMREPTEKMLRTYGEFGTLDIDAYQAMIDSITNGR